MTITFIKYNCGKTTQNKTNKKTHTTEAICESHRDCHSHEMLECGMKQQALLSYQERAHRLALTSEGRKCEFSLRHPPPTIYLLSCLFVVPT